MKKDLLWVWWVHGRYLKTIQWWDFKLPTDACWSLKKLYRVKDQFKWASTLITDGTGRIIPKRLTQSLLGTYRA